MNAATCRPSDAKASPQVQALSAHHLTRHPYFYYGSWADSMTTEKKRIRRTRAEIQASQIDDLVAGLRALNPDDIAALGQKLQVQAPRTTAALWDALSDRDLLDRVGANAPASKS